jgi:hypothetical protein
MLRQERKAPCRVSLFSDYVRTGDKQEKTMKSLMLAGAMIAALAASASVANAGEAWRDGYYARYRQGDVTQPRRGAYAWNYRQCWSDEGYGRYSPCDSRR